MNPDLVTKTVGQLFLSAAREFKHRRFIFRPDGSFISYEDAVIGVALRVSELLRLGIKKGDYIICYCEKPVLSIHFFLAAQFIGAIPVPVAPIFNPKYASDLANRIEAKFIFCESQHAQSFIQKTITFEDLKNDNDLHKNFSSVCEFLEQIHSAINSENIVILQATAGSTGQPKMVIRRHSALTYYARNLAPELENNPNSPHRYLMLLSFAHSFAYHQFTTALILGAELGVPWAIDSDVSLKEIFELAPTVMCLPPRVLSSFVMQETAPISSASKNALFPLSVKFIVIGGGEGNANQLRRLNSEGITPIQIYSTSETSMIAMTKNKQWKESCTGKPLPEIEFKIVESEIHVKSPGMMLGYLNDPEADKNGFCENGFFRTGDLGALTEDGNLRILGRKKDVFGTPEGSLIFPSRVEDLIETRQQGSQVILIGNNRPFLCALIYIPNCSGYEAVASLLSDVNSQLQRPEQIVRFLLLEEPFAENCYQIVQGSKVRRNRDAIERTFSIQITELYSSICEPDVTFVPGVDRRLRR